MVNRTKLKIVIIGVSLLAGALFFFKFNPNGQLFFPKCPIHNHLGIYCSGCGSQRAIHDLLHLRFYDAISHNLLLIPSLLVVAVELSMRFFFPHKKSLFYYRATPIIAVMVIVLFMILRNIDRSPFNWLAP